MVAVSERRLSALKDGEIEIREAYTKSELGVSLVASTSTGVFLRSTAVSHFEEEMLPLKGETLPNSEETAELVSAPFRARALNASVILLRLFPGTRTHEAPAVPVGDVLSSFAAYVKQKLEEVYRQGALAVGKAIDLLDANLPEVNVVGTFAGSLGVEFAVRSDNPAVRVALQGIVSDLALVGNLDALLDKTANTSIDELQALKKFLARMIDAKSDLSVETASVGDEVATTANLSLKRVRRASRHLRVKPETGDLPLETLVVQLVGLNVRAKTFEVHRLDSDVPMKGLILAGVFSGITKAALPSPYRVVMKGLASPDSNTAVRGQRLTIISATAL